MDANDESHGGFVLKHLNKEICSAKFDKYEKGGSSRYSELLTVKYVLTSFGYFLKNSLFKLILIIPALVVFYQLLVQNHTYNILL